MIIDTSVLIDMIRKGRYLEGGNISIITLLEILRGINEEKRVEVKETIEEVFNVINLDNEIVLKYCKLYDELRKRGKTLPDADLLIAATAIAMNDELISNDSDFRRLEKLGLKLGSLKD